MLAPRLAARAEPPPSAVQVEGMAGLIRPFPPI